MENDSQPEANPDWRGSIEKKAHSPRFEMLSFLLTPMASETGWVAAQMRFKFNWSEEGLGLSCWGSRHPEDA
jgi:hypothetical protein